VKLEKNKDQEKRLLVHSLPQDKIIFIDTSFIIDALFYPNTERLKNLEIKKRRNDHEEREYHKLQFHMHKHDVSVKFVERLIKEKINITFSSILFHEFYFASKYIELDKVFKDRKKTQEALKKDPKILSEYIPDILKNWNLFMDLLGKFKGRIFPITPSDPNIIKETLRIRTTYGLQPNDSLHLGTIIAGNIKDIVVFDFKFREAAINEGLNVWYKV